MKLVVSVDLITMQLTETVKMKFKKMFALLSIAMVPAALMGCGGSWGGSLNIGGSENGVSYEANVTYTMLFRRAAGLPSPYRGHV